MKAIKTSDLKPGMKFDKPVYVDGVNLLVPEMIEIKEKDIKRLEKWNITEVATEGKLIRDLPVEGKTSFFQQAFNTPEQQQVLEAYTRISKAFQAATDVIKDGSAPSVDAVDGIIDEIIGLLRKLQNDVVQFILYGMQGESGFAENGLNSAVLSILVGTNISFPQHKLIQLATGALLHDVGMLRLPAQVLNKQGSLTPEELKTVKTHPIHAYKIITRELRYPEEIGMMVLQHHERWDGKGYPKGLSGKSMVLPARIIAVVDAFEAMVSKRPYRSSMIGYTAMRTILGDNGRRFDPEVLKIFIRTMGIYPVGSVVLLNDGSVGRVVATNPQATMRPKVKVMIDRAGREYERDEGNVIDLLADKNTFIAKAVDPKDLSEENGKSQSGKKKGG